VRNTTPPPFRPPPPTPNVSAWHPKKKLFQEFFYSLRVVLNCEEHPPPPFGPPPPTPNVSAWHPEKKLFQDFSILYE